MRVDLPLPVLPTMAVVSPGSRLERDVAQDRLLGARVAELDVAELEPHAVSGGAVGSRDRVLRVADGRLRCRGPRWMRPAETAARGHEDEHEHGHQHREQDLHQVLQERGQVADRHLAAVDAHRAEPHDRDRRQVEDRGHHRDRDREQAVDPERRVEQVAVRRRRSARSSCSVRTNARMTRTPASVSRMTWLIRSSLTCIARNSGIARHMTSAMNDDHDRQDDDEQAGQRARPGGGP